MRQNFRKKASLLRTFSIPLLLMSLLVSSSSYAPQPDQQATAILKIYKRGGYGRSGFSLTINNQLVCKKLKSRSWFEVEVPAGKLKLETAPHFEYPTYEGKSFSFEVEEEKVYYLEAVIDYEFFVSRTYLVQRDSAQAMKEMKRYKLDKNAKNRLE